MDGFRLAIDRIVGDLRPDVVVHSGDLFDHAHPTPHAVDFAMRQLRRLSDARIPLVIIEGDHSSPRIPGQGQVLRILSHLPMVDVVCDGYGRVDVGDVAIHAVPHRAVAMGFVLDENAIDAGKINILLAHAVAEGYPYYNTARLAAPLTLRQSGHLYDYIALGHHHRFSQIDSCECAFYAGSTALVARGDFRPGYQFGFNLADFDSGTMRVQRVTLPTRPMHSYGLHDAAGLSPREVMTFIGRQVEAVSPKEADCQIVIDGLEPVTRRDLTVQDIAKFFSGHASMSIWLRVRELTGEEVSESASETSPAARFQRLAGQVTGNEIFREAVRAAGVSILEEAQSLITAEDAERSE